MVLGITWEKKQHSVTTLASLDLFLPKSHSADGKASQWSLRKCRVVFMGICKSSPKPDLGEPV